MIVGCEPLGGLLHGNHIGREHLLLRVLIRRVHGVFHACREVIGTCRDNGLLRLDHLLSGFARVLLSVLC